METMWRICILILEIKGLNSSGHSKEILVIFKKETLCIIFKALKIKIISFYSCSAKENASRGFHKQRD